MYTSVGIGITTNVFGSQVGAGGPVGPVFPNPIDNEFSMEFDSASSSAFSVTDEVLGGLSAFSISFWYNATSFTSDRPIVARWNIGPASFLLYHDNPNGWRVLFTTSLGSGGTQSTLIGTPNIWQYFGVSWDGNTIKMYLRDFVGTSSDWSAASSPGGTINATAPWRIGNDDTRSMDGYIDELAIWNSALPQSTFEGIFQCTVDNPGQVANLNETPEGAPLAWYRMGDN